ncbi:flagellar hook-length control protein FliK [Methylobacterium segetis]|uniref:flagellar hook-length control protein FliK n=1 Tax=Methylobacterium segetis TaxID=2488750 RepID=UPI0010529945|nr:flagellar hook-length control protein FliK [Methylobacterium segetis]
MGFTAADLMDATARRPSLGATQDLRQARTSAPARERFSLDLGLRERPAVRETPRRAEGPAADRAGDPKATTRRDLEPGRPKAASADRAPTAATGTPARAGRGAEAAPRPAAPQAGAGQDAPIAPMTAKASAAAQAPPAGLGEAVVEAQVLAEIAIPQDETETADEEAADEDTGQPAGGLLTLLSALQAPPVPTRLAPGQDGAGSREPTGEGLEAPRPATADGLNGPNLPGLESEAKLGAAANAAAQGARRAGASAEVVPAATETEANANRLDFSADLAATLPPAPPADPKILGREAAASGAPAHAAQGAEKAAAQPPSPPVSIGQVPMTIGLRSLGGSSQFEIRLDPAELGRVDVRLEIDKERGTVTTHLVVERVETLAMLQRDANGLQQALTQAGLDPSEGGINLSLRGDGQPGSGAEQREGQRRGAQAFAENPEIRALDAAPLRSLRGLGGLDIRI